MRNASTRENHPTQEKATRGVSPFLAWGDFHARSRFAHSTIPEEKWGITPSLPTLGYFYSDVDLNADFYSPATFYALQAVVLVTAIVVNNLHSCFALS